MQHISTQTTPEEWRPVVEYEGLYEVSNRGRVRSVDRIVHYRSGPIRRFEGVGISLNSDMNGYPTAKLSRHGGSSKRYVHRLVLRAFVGEPPEGHEACHLDDDRTNNNLENLRWGTQSDNMQDRIRNGRHPLSEASSCKRGHPYSESNTPKYALRIGYRLCLACTRARGRVKDHPELAGDIQKISDSYYADIHTSGGGA